jgi:hypothetical protein
MLLELEKACRHVCCHSGEVLISACHAWKACEHIHNCQTAPHGAPRTRARVCTHLQQHTAPHRHRLASQVKTHEHTPPARRNQIHTLKQSRTLLHIQTCTRARTRTHERARARAHTHKRACARTHTPTHALPHTHARRHLHLKLHTHAHACACVRASTRARTHTHTHIQAQHADESARREIEPFLVRTLTHRT